MISPEHRKFGSNLQTVWNTIAKAGKHNKAATDALKHAIGEWKASVNETSSFDQAHYLGMVAGRIEPLLSVNANEVDLLQVASLLAEIANQYDIALPAGSSPHTHLGYTDQGLEQLLGVENGQRVEALIAQQRRGKILKKQTIPKKKRTVPELPKRELKLLTVSLERTSDLFLPYVMEFGLDDDGSDDTDLNLIEEIRESQRVDNIRADITKALEQWRSNEGKSAEGQAVLNHFQSILSFPGNNRRKEISERILLDTKEQLAARRQEAGTAWTKAQLAETGAKLTRKNVHALIRTLLAPIANANLDIEDNEIDKNGAAAGQHWRAVYLARAAARTLFLRSYKPQDRAMIEALTRAPDDPKHGPDTLRTIIDRALVLAK